MGCFSYVSLVLIFLSILTSCSGLPYWLRRSSGRQPRFPTLGRSQGADKMSLRRGSPLFQPGSRSQPISGRNKLFMAHLQLSLNRGSGSDQGTRALGHTRRRPSSFRAGRHDSRRITLPGLRTSGLEMPRIKGMKAFRANRLRKPMKNIRLNSFLTRLGKIGQPSGLSSVTPKGGHRKREQNVLSEGQTRIESSPVILTYDSPPGKPGSKDKGKASEDDTYIRDHSQPEKHDSYRSPEEFFAQYPSSHLVPCARTDRHKCLNGGICVNVDALDIKTCR